MKYVVAVSGGVDSMVLLHMLHTQSPHELIVAHFDHAVRSDSQQDTDLVERTAGGYGLDFVTSRLGDPESKAEDYLRSRRYEWLESVRREMVADAIVTAHHADDVIETLMINLSRGTGWRGGASLRSTDTLLRPLLKVPKAEIVRYAIENRLEWREDYTNNDIRYFRNFLRHGAVGGLDMFTKKNLMSIIDRQHELRDQIEQEVELQAARLKTSTGYRRYDIIMLPDMVALEILRYVTGGVLEPFQMRRLLHFIKTGRSGAIMQAGGGIRALLSVDRVLL